MGMEMQCYAMLYYSMLKYTALSEKCEYWLVSPVYMKICVRKMYLKEVDILQRIALLPKSSFATNSKEQP